MTRKDDKTSERQMRELCRILEVQADVTVQDLKKAYYRLAKRFHPDKNPDDAFATTQFILVSTAYQTLYSELHSDGTTRVAGVEKRSQTGKSRPRSSPRASERSPSTAQPEASVPNRSEYPSDTGRRTRETQIDELLRCLFRANLSTPPNGQNQTPQSSDPDSDLITLRLIESKADLDQATDAHTPEHQPTNSSGCMSPDQWLKHQHGWLENFRAGRRNTTTCSKSSTSSRKSSIESNSSHTVNPDLLPVMTNPDLLRCAHCYRTFRMDIAARHVEHCSRKATSTGGQVPNSLGQTVATGCSPSLLRSRQYADTVMQRLNLKPNAPMKPPNMTENPVGSHPSRTE